MIGSPQPEGIVSLHVSHNLVDWSHNGAFFEYSDFGLRSISPYHGPVEGGTVVRFEVQGMPLDPAASQLRCIFGVVQTVATILAPASVTCISPGRHTASLKTTVDKPVPVPGFVPVHLTASSAVLNLDQVVYFRYEMNDEIYKLSPSSGPTSGGTLVTLQGRFSLSLQSSDCFCAFWAPAMTQQVVVAQCVPPVERLFVFFESVCSLARSASWHRIICISPVHAAGFALIRVSTNGQNFSASTEVFTFLHGKLGSA